MTFLIRQSKKSDIKSSEITSQDDYQNRRQFMQQSAAAVGGALILPNTLQAKLAVEADGTKLKGVAKTDYLPEEPLTSFKQITTYNNFYEFGTGKSDPYRNAQHFNTDPWSITVEGHCENPGVFNLEDFISPAQLEERIYRFRCVEAWSMVIPWVGVSLADVLKRFKPTSNAKYVEFTTLYDPKQMPGQARRILDWPYREGLRIDEAMNPLSFLAVGLYGEVLPNQNGAPIRLVIPWKYGFKSIKSITGLRFTEQQPVSSWTRAAPREYGFYSNVNPDVDHPRWSQRKERRIGEFFKRKTLMFNGYAEQVAHLYKGMDLRKYY